MQGLSILLVLVLTAGLLVLGESTIWSDGEQHGVEAWCPDGKPPQRSVMTLHGSDESDDEVARQIAEILREAERSGRPVENDPRLLELFSEGIDGQLVILGAEEC